MGGLVDGRFVYGRIGIRADWYMGGLGDGRIGIWADWEMGGLERGRVCRGRVVKGEGWESWG